MMSFLQLTNAILQLTAVEGSLCIIVSKSDARLAELRGLLLDRGFDVRRLAQAGPTAHDGKEGIRQAAVRCILLNPGDDIPSYSIPLSQYRGRISFETLDAACWPDGISESLIRQLADWKNCSYDASGAPVREIDPPWNLSLTTGDSMQEVQSAVAEAIQEVGALIVVACEDAEQVMVLEQQLIASGIRRDRIVTADRRQCSSLDRVTAGKVKCVLLDPGRDGPSYALPLEGRYRRVTVLDLDILYRTPSARRRIRNFVGES